MKKLYPILNLILPTVIFWAVYKLFGMLPATFLSLLVSLSNSVLHYLKDKEISNTQVLGLVGLVLSGVSISLSGNEKWYYVPPLANNIVLFVFLLILAVRRKSVFLYLAKDFHIKSLEQIEEREILGLNYLWLFFFLVKCITKIAGLLFLDFEKMYWLVFFMGDPAMILVALISAGYIRSKMN